jgi:hypothetical protein
MKNRSKYLYFADQFISSGSSFLVITLTLFQSNSQATSEFFYILAIYAIYISITQSILGESLLVQYRNYSVGVAARSYFLSSMKVCAVLSLIAGSALLILGFNLFLVHFCLVVFFVLGMQDSFRFYCMAESRIKVLITSDLIWLTGTPIIFLLNPAVSLYRSVFNWAIPGLLAAILMAYGYIKYFRKYDAGNEFQLLGTTNRFLPIEVISGAVSNFLATLFLISIFGFESVAVLRVIQTIFGLVNILINSGKTVGVKFADSSDSPSDLLNLIRRDASIVTSTSFLVAVFIFFVPDQYLDFFSSSSILISVKSLFIIFIFERICVGFLMSVTVIERISGNVARSSLVRSICFPLAAITASLNAYLFDSLIGFALGSALIYMLAGLTLSFIHVKNY